MRQHNVCLLFECDAPAGLFTGGQATPWRLFTAPGLQRRHRCGEAFREREALRAA